MQSIPIGRYEEVGDSILQPSEEGESTLHSLTVNTN